MTHKTQPWALIYAYLKTAEDYGETTHWDLAVERYNGPDDETPADVLHSTLEADNTLNRSRQEVEEALVSFVRENLTPDLKSSDDYEVDFMFVEFE